MCEHSVDNYNKSGNSFSSFFILLRFLNHHHHYYCQHMIQGKPFSQQGGNTQNTQ